MSDTRTGANGFLSQSNKSAFRNPWVWGWIALVVIVFAVNAGMVATAVLTNPGLVEEDYYEKGREFEQTFLKRMAARSALGWELGIEVPSRLVTGKSSVVRLTATDKNGLPISGAEVTLTAYRPSDATADFTIPMKEIVPGQYDGFADFPLKGIWELKARITKGEDSFDLSRRIIVTSN